MATAPQPPSALAYESTGPNSVRVSWIPVDGVDHYEARGGGAPLIRTVTDTETELKGLRPSRHSMVEVRSVLNDEYSDWAQIEVRPSDPVPAYSVSNAAVIDVIDADRQSVQMTLPRPDGTDVDVRLLIWWEPTDLTWWAALEAPVNTPAIRSRSLGLNVGLFDDVRGILAGNIVMRSTRAADTTEPDRQAFVRQTHWLLWEPD